MIVTIPHNEEISENGKNRWKKEVGFAISRRKANRGKHKHLEMRRMRSHLEKC